MGAKARLLLALALCASVRTDAPDRVRRADRMGGSKVQRVDRWRLDLDDTESITELPNGMLEVTGVATRVGVFPYLDSEGGTFLELRPREEVMRKASLDSLRGAPFTIDHPADDVTIDNAQSLTHGWVIDVWADGDLVKTRIRVATRDALDEIRDGTVELSCGYTAFLEHSEGVTRDGEVFHAIQRDIVYNHLALVDLARAGPVARLRLDAAAILTRRVESTDMKTITIIHDGKRHQIDAAFSSALSEGAERARKDDQIPVGKLSVEIGGETADLVLPEEMLQSVLGMIGATSEAPAEPAPEPAEMVESTEVQPLDQPNPVNGVAGTGPVEETDTEEEEVMDQDEEKIARGDVQKLIDAAIASSDKRRDAKALHRASVERQAGPVLGESYDWARSDAVSIQAATIKAVQDKDATAVAANARKGDARSQGRLDAMFEAAVEQWRSDRDSGGRALAAFADSAERGANAGAPVSKLEEARKKMQDRRQGPSKSDKAKTAG